MAYTVKIKNSSVPAKVPAAGSIDVAELAVNLADKKLYTKDTGGTVFELTPPAASDTVSGVIEIATQAEVDAGTDAVRAVTAATLKQYVATNAPTPPDASETVKGVIELATQAEVDAGTDTVRAVTAATLKQYVATNAPTPPDASDAVKGIIELATQAEVDAGTDAVRAVTPATLKAAVGGSLVWGEVGTALYPTTNTNDVHIGGADSANAAIKLTAAGAGTFTSFVRGTTFTAVNTSGAATSALFSGAGNLLTSVINVAGTLYLGDDLVTSAAPSNPKVTLTGSNGNANFAGKVTAVDFDVDALPVLP